MKRKKRNLFWAMLAVLIVVTVWIAWGNAALTVNEIMVTSERIPQSFSGFRIAQVSDLHNAELGDANSRLIEKLKACHPDVIVLTGDLADSYHTDIEIAIAFAEQAVQIAPIYYVEGNHEARIANRGELLERLEEKGVTVLQNESVVLEKGGERITLLGVRDPSFQTHYRLGDTASVMDSALSEMMKESEGYTVLLSHRPELFAVYVSNHVDLALTGHAHGGQFRLPFVGGVFAPEQGLFPKYDAGLYRENNTNMVVSRGIGNSIIPFRVNNRPEIVVVTLNA